MGSPVSAVIANLYMEEFEEQAIATATYKPKIWKRYVDDTFTVLGKDYVDGFLQHLNSQQPTIRFTMEIEKDNTIPFLDTSVSRDSNARGGGGWDSHMKLTGMLVGKLELTP